jgi:uncharacterized protein
MSSWLSEREQRLVAGAETASAATPIPTQIVSNGEYLPPGQSETQKHVERRILELADESAGTVLWVAVGAMRSPTPQRTASML